MLRRALGTAAAVTIAATAAVVAPAAADHPGHSEQECRGYPSYPGSPNPWIKIVAEDNQFDTDCLQGPANRKFRIYLDNRDSDPHNISIYSADPSKDKKAEQFYKGKAVKGPGQEEYAIDELPPGEYFFRDDKTPGMTGTLSIPKPKK
ncbi:MAG: cupredoxin domain-containing protein [Actinomycetota bacterium]